MSKKKKAAPARKAVKKAKTPARKASTRALTAAAPALSSNLTAAATIFIYQIDGETRVRTSPQRIGAGPGFLEWTVVNLASDKPVDVDITWRDTDPWGGKAPINIKNGNVRVNMAGARDGVYKYSVTVGTCTEDPEVEIPWN